MKLVSIGELRVWWECGCEVLGWVYFVKFGDFGFVFWIMLNVLLIMYIIGLMVGDGVGLEWVVVFGELVINCLLEGGYYLNWVLIELKDGMDVLVWWEDEK